MKWIQLTSENQWQEVLQRSTGRTQVVFKYSSRCSLSDMIRYRLEKSTPPDDIDFYFLDIIAYRAVSNAIAKDLSVHHESPQVLVIRNKECVYDESHNAIRMDEIIAQSMVG